MFAITRPLKEAATANLLVDQNALAVADRAYMLEVGSIALAGRGAGLLGTPRVRHA